MKQGLTLPELAARVQSEQERKRDIVADTRTMQFESNGATRLLVDETDGVGEFVMTEHAHGQIATHLGIPKRYYDRMRGEAPELLDRNANHWLHTQTGAKGDAVRRMIRVFKPEPGAASLPPRFGEEPTVERVADAVKGGRSGTVRAFLSDRYRRLDYDDLLAHVLPIFGEMGIGNGAVASCNLSDTKLYLKVLFPRIMGEVSVGEIVQAGICITDSEVGDGALAVEPLVYKLVCKNGLIVQDRTLRRLHVGKRIEDTEAAMAVFSDETLRLDDKALFAKVADAVRASASQAAFDLICQDLRDLAGKRVSRRPVEAIQELGKRTDLTEDEQGSVLQHLIEGGDLSAWGYVNAVTRAAQDCDDYARSDDLERLGGQILADPALVLA